MPLSFSSIGQVTDDAQDNLSVNLPSPSYTQEVEAFPSDSAVGWLQKMAYAHSNLNYSISFVLLKPGVDSQPYLWRHGVDALGAKMEQLNLLNGPGREVVRIGNKVSYFEPNVPPYSLQSNVINGPFPSEFFQRPEEIEDSYDFVMVGRSRVSGRAAQQIRIVSKDKSRFGMNVWLDQETGLMLKLNLVDLNGQLLEQIQVTACNVTEQPDDFFDKVEPAMLPEVLKLRPQTHAKAIWNIAYMPVGMVEVKRDIHRLPITGQSVEYVMLSDGLVDVSIYMRESQNDGVNQDILLRHESDTLLTLNQGKLNVTVVGKLPPETASHIANSIHLATN
ncbi:MucB/RseB C-terminal domain-containing protein [Paraglaciecola polaris]|uniref:Sigma-E factor negative regulatory protein RseB n=1 Tax=Paraglaciecola polaris LMG 21857 TaxID=1129793 RepID=K7ADY2_9ALTE|nr:MucB/RseB C-terminal domain-containing protein [Paraglaciecola polaris]GAC33545.1 sigma-E factor negative regulatory protein RseB [Paraglaciecola polaris LMG 21857]|tara:strand:+ start:11216 stop:12217 length:1002 start_codon:yes stop_codon:yes gene_type:complete